MTFPTMVILNTAPDAPNPFDEMPFTDLLPLFAASLSETQYNALTSAGGLPIGGLSEMQKNMAMQIFEGGKFLAAPWTPHQFGPAPEKPLNFTAQIDQTCFRIKETMDVMLPAEGGGGYPGMRTPPSDPNALKLVERQDYGGARDRVYGQVVRATVPNEPKRSQLNLRLESLRRTMPVDGLTTVAEVIARIAKVSGIELYADARWNGKTAQILAASGAVVAAGDLLQAVAFCLSATFRSLSPAFVMTDDIVGYGTRRLLWYEFEKLGDALRRQPSDTARETLYTRYKDRKLPNHGDPAALTEAQQKEDWNMLPAKGYVGRSLADYTPEQQNLIRRMIATFQETYTTQKVKEDGNFRLSTAVSLQLVVPGAKAPVETGIQLDKGFLQRMPEGEQKANELEQWAKSAAQNEANYDKDPEKFLALYQKYPILWTQLLAHSPDVAKRMAAKYPALNAIAPALGTSLVSADEIAKAWTAAAKNRAVRIYPKTVADVAGEMDAAKRIGATEAWLMAFQDGKYRADVVDAALIESKNAGTPLTLMLNLLDGGKNPYKYARRGSHPVWRGLDRGEGACGKANRTVG